MSAKSSGKREVRSAMPSNSQAPSLLSVLRAERKQFDERLSKIVEAVAGSDYSARGLVNDAAKSSRYAEIKAYLSKLRFAPADPVLACCDTPAGKLAPKINKVSINFLADGRISVSLSATHACGVCAYSLAVTIYEYFPASSSYSVLTRTPTLGETDLDGPLDRTWSRPLPKLSKEAAFYRVEVVGQVWPHCIGIGPTPFAKNSVGPI